MTAAFGTRISRPRSPLFSTSRAVITLVTLAIGRCVFTSRPHRTWPVAASASTAPLAFTPPGAPVTLIAGRTDGRAAGRDGEGGAGTLVPAAAVAAGRGTAGAWAATVGAHATTPPIMAVPAINPAIRPLRRMTANVPTCAQIRTSGSRQDAGLAAVEHHEMTVSGRNPGQATGYRSMRRPPARTIMAYAPRQRHWTPLSPPGGTMADMARRTATPPPPEDFEENIVDIDVAEEMRGSYLEYAYSVIYQRALPDARDGLKPVQRRILYQMNEMGLRPDRGHVKSARVVGEVMGRLHPHGDSAIYDALVRMAQPWAMRLPLVDGHGNFGSPGGDDSPAAMRYTEARLTAAAMEMVASIDEDTVDFQPNYDGTETQPEVLPAGLPNLLVNGTAGIAVGMATNMAPHNLGEVIAAARHLIANPEASLDELMRYVPGPDLPTGGKIVGLDGIREAYETGRGIFRTRATARVEKITPRRDGIVVTELPYGVGPEKVISRIKDLVQAKKLAGIADLKDLTDRHRGLHLVIEVRGGFHPEAILDELYRLTPMEETFGINNVALVDGQPRVLGLRELLSIYVDHRIDVVRRRCEFRRRKRADRLHLVDGLLIALLNIDEVIQVIRASDDSAQAKERLMSVFDLSEIQAQYILDTPLRRLTRYDRLELERERETLQREIAELTAILESETKLRKLVSTELGEAAGRFASPRRTVLLEGSGKARTAAVPLEVADDPCLVLLSSAGLIARTATRPAGDPAADGTLEAALDSGSLNHGRDAAGAPLARARPTT